MLLAPDGTSHQLHLHYAHFSDGETEAREVKQLAQVTAGRWQAVCAPSPPYLVPLLCSLDWSHPSPEGGTQAGLSEEQDIIKHLLLPRHFAGGLTEPTPPPIRWGRYICKVSH